MFESDYSDPVNIGSDEQVSINQMLEIIEGISGVKKLDRDYLLDKPKGVLIQSIVEDGSAADADIKPMDIIIKVDDREVNQPNELQSYVASKRAGEKVVLTLFRDGDMITRTVTLKSKDGEETVASSKETKEPEEKKEVENSKRAKS